MFKPEYKEAIDNNIEIWVSLQEQGFPKYEISSYGSIRHNLKKTGVLKQLLGDDGYRRVDMQVGTITPVKKKTRKTHRLLALTFLVKPVSEKPLTVDHIDRNILNNDLHNLRWATGTQQNLNRAPYQQKCLPINQCNMDGSFIRQWKSMKEAIASNPEFNRGIRNALNGNQTSAHGYHWEYQKNEIEGEEWKIHPYLGVYVSDKGRVKRKNGIPTIGNIRSRRDVLSINRQKYDIARLVAETFFGVHDDHKVVHLDGNFRNNHKENLKFVPVAKSYVRPSSAAKPARVICASVIQVDPETRKVLAHFVNMKLAAASVGRSYNTINFACKKRGSHTKHTKICAGYKWRYATDPKYTKKLEAFHEDTRKRKRDEENEEKGIKRVKTM